MTHTIRVMTMTVLLAAAALGSTVAEAPPAGHLVIIGGGNRPDGMVRRVVELAGGEACRMLVIPMASAEPLETALYQKWQFEEAGCPQVNFVRFDRESADSDETLTATDGVTGVFFSGGDQNRLLEAMAGTQLLERVRQIHVRGGVVAGTSAGAAVMSRIMITGDEALHPEEPQFDTIRPDNIVTKEGFGFVDLAIVDQHFVARRRHNRLLSLVLENPSLIGVGIDEATAIVVDGSDTFEVIGEATVVVYDATAAHHVHADDDGDLSAHSLTMHLLRAGDRYDLRERAVLEAAER